MAGIRIGVNALYLIPGAVGGTEIYLRSLLGALARLDTENQYVIFTNVETGEAIRPPAANFACRVLPVRARNRPARIFWEQLRLPGMVKRERLDVLFNPGFTAPLRCPCPAVTVFHDLQHKRHPEHFRWFDLPFWRLFLFQSARTSTALIAVSEATRADLLRYYSLPRRKVRVVRHGVDEQCFEVGRRRREIEPEPYLLCVSTLHPHKNLERLLRAFAAFRERRPAFRLVIAGLRGFHAAVLEALIGELGLEEGVRLTGWIPREELYDLYLRAHAFVFPSTFEGFGLPVLEALAAGVPTVCSSITPLREVAGNAAVRFDPLDEQALLAALERVTGDEKLRRRLALEGPEHAARFSWRESAAKTLEILRTAAARR